MGIANPYYGGNFDKDDWNRCEECGDIITSKRHYLHGKLVCKKCNENDELITLNEWKNGINGFIEDIK
jgi:DNA-directed RNA polymerase subunit M/transcription elongation factor TFIIS